MGVTLVQELHLELEAGFGNKGDVHVVLFGGRKDAKLRGFGQQLRPSNICRVRVPVELLQGATV